MRTCLIGRWQPPHLGHLYLVKNAVREGEVILGVGSALESNTLKNPFSAGERIEMWKRVLDPEGIQVTFVTIPDAPDNRTWVEYVKKICPSFDRAVTGDPLSYKLLSEAGFNVGEPVFFKKEVFNGTGVRDLIVNGDQSWRKLVPEQVVQFIGEIHGEKRLIDIARR
jgi:nicotinamide-nucleotide adenylyltransferase